MFLHGFPDSSHVWRHQVPALVDAGMRVIAPDLRGTGQSDKPEAVMEYAISRSIADAAAVMDELGIERAQVVGQDWGAAVAWILAAFSLRGDGDVDTAPTSRGRARSPQG